MLMFQKDKVGENLDQMFCLVHKILVRLTFVFLSHLKTPLIFQGGDLRFFVLVFYDIANTPLPITTKTTTVITFTIICFIGGIIPKRLVFVKRNF